MAYVPLNVRTPSSAVHARRDARHNVGAGPVGFAPTPRRRAPHGPGFRPMGWSCGDVALYGCSAAAWATVPGGARRWPIRADVATQHKTKRPTRVVSQVGRRKTSRLEGATYCSGLSVRLPAALLTARESRAVTDIGLDGLAPLTDARQLVDCRLGCRMAWSEIAEKNTVMW